MKMVHVWAVIVLLASTLSCRESAVDQRSRVTGDNEVISAQLPLTIDSRYQGPNASTDSGRDGSSRDSSSGSAPVDPQYISQNTASSSPSSSTLTRPQLGSDSGSGVGAAPNPPPPCQPNSGGSNDDNPTAPRDYDNGTSPGGGGSDFCPTDVRYCPVDGVWVGRDPENSCAFRACPTSGGGYACLLGCPSCGEGQEMRQDSVTCECSCVSRFGN